MVDQLTGAKWMFAAVNRDEDAEPLEFPSPYPRPGFAEGAAESPPSTATSAPDAAELARFFDG
jgi:hypothetical protein